jgi:hypothetical protein
MQRRELLTGGAVVGVLGASLAGCSSPPRSSLPPSALPPPEDMDAFCDELESKLAGISHSKFVDGFVERFAKGEPLSAERRARVEAREALFRRSLRSLLLTQSFRDLPSSAQQHPRLQGVMQGHLPEVDETVFEVTEMLEALSADEREALRTELVRRPELPMSISEVIDEHAAAAGVSVNRRRQLRSMLTQASFRLRHAAPDTLIDEYTTKVRRATAPGGAAQALALAAASQATADLFFAAPPGSITTGGVSTGGITSSSVPTGGAAAGPGAQGWAPATGSPVAGGPTSAARRKRAGSGAGKPPPRPSPPEPGGHPGSSTVTTGAWLLGIGLVTVGVSAAVIASGGTALVVGVTIGALLFAIGLVVLLVGAIIYAAN